ncbi:hypothetical protein BCV69DRAFT_288844 [Microstroma glucosiphilum]|uniref:RING-type domain-containing protein n=1 Tax=Pseudomicrostroma glucosiphilum TaxID=1684307 RepID=A0A316UH59_9BASI|nr:hypothetical protein BCV69DRAFT_288844 [Pseudomicrostroma glucosiphilum]PWN23681.1 hypothetical protein BCV69DRAFT_288844 [Pseudomicrostroma glucosiphilum]
MSAIGHNMASMNPRGKHLAASGDGGGGGGGGRDRGQNINHLLSFTLPPRARPPPPTNARRSKRSGGTPFNKERYVSAQYRFLVKPTGDYTAYFADADIYLNWGDILSVLIPTSSALSGAATSALPSSSQPSLETHEGAACPICLSPPTAPRMTKCGHVYCYPCILQYLSTTDGPASAGPAPIPGAPVGASVNSGNALTGPTNRQWKRCPICWDAVYARDLKAVRWWDPKAVAAQQDRQPAAGNEQIGDIIGHFESGDEPSTSQQAPSTQNPDYLRMRLMERPQITTLALPQSSTWPTSSTSPSDQPLLAQHQAPWHFQPDVMTYCKFMLATPDLLLESLTQDVDELAAEKKLLSSFGSTQGDDTIAYVTLAEKKVSEQMGKVINELDTPAVRSAIGQAKNDLKEHEEAERGQRVRDSENTSRRRRRQIEREKEEHRQSEDAKAAEDGESKVEDSQDDTSSTPLNTPSVESSEGAEAFLALRAQGQGGSYLPRPKEEAKASAAMATSSDEATNAAPPTAPAPKSHQRPRRNLNPPAPSSSSYLFYQAASGQNIYLHPLDIKVLHSQFGAYSRFPRDIAVKVQGAEEGSMNEELQKRCKYLTHLPKGTDVVFIEVDWESMAAVPANSPSTEGGMEASEPRLIEEKTLKPYSQVLRARRNKRRDKERKEDRAKLKAEEAEAASRPGGAAAAARHHQQQQQMQSSNGRHVHMLSSSYGSEGGRSAVSSHGQATSPTFMESALWGAERDFPIHPGHHGGVDDEFPSALALTAASSSSPNMTPTRSPASSATQPSSRTGTGSKTVWGTVAPKPSFSSTLHASSRGTSGAGGAGGAWDEDVDDAWLELEEGFVLGTNNSRQVRPGRGLNSQQGNRRTNGTAGSGATTGVGAAGKGDGGRAAPIEGEKGSTTPGAVPSGGGGGGGGKKQRKAKLVLTGGGRGTG